MLNERTANELDWENRIQSSIKAQLADYPNKITLTTMMAALMPEDFGGITNCTEEQRKVYETIRNMAMRIIDATGMYKSKQYGVYTKIGTKEVPSMPSDLPTRPIGYVPQSRIVSIAQAREKEVEINNPLPDKDKKPLKQALAEIAAEQRVDIILNASADPNKNPFIDIDKAEYGLIMDGLLVKLANTKEPANMRQIRKLMSQLEDLMDQEEETTEDQEEIEDSIEQHELIKEEIEETLEESLHDVIVDNKKKEQNIDNNPKPLPMLNLSLKFIQYLVDEQPKGKRASYVVNRSDHDKLVTDIIQLYALRLTTDPEPEDVQEAVKLWYEECTKELDDSEKADYKKFVVNIVQWYFNTFNGVDDRLKKMLDAFG